VAQLLAAEHRRSLDAILELTGHATLLEGVPAFQRSIERRAAYLDPLSDLQIHALSRLRTAAPAGDRAALDRLVALTISGIAAGVQGTG
jgi:phosphoenolpyruvate carboxylase